MMTRAYSELYLEDAMNNLGEAFDYAANACNMDKDLFMSFFINTDMSYSFERGNPMVIAGMSEYRVHIQKDHENHHDKGNRDFISHAA